MNGDNQSNTTGPSVIQPVFQSPLPPTPPEPHQSGKRKRIILAVLALLALFIAAGVAYVLLVYIPNTPENVLKKAVSNFADGGNYTITGRLDHGDGNAPDFNYTIKTAGSDALVIIDSSTFVMGPNVELMQVGGAKYVKFDEWMDAAELANHYANYTSPGIQEALAEFAGTTGIYANQGKWIQVDDFVFDNPAGSDSAPPASIEEAGISIDSIGSAEQKDGKRLQNYKIKLTKDGFARLLDQISGSSIPRSVFDKYVANNGFPESISLDLQVDKSTKTIHSLSYSGRPFRDATLSLDLSPGENSFTAPENAPLASKVLDYGIVRTLIFNPDFQSADGAGDRERIADIKGIKMAMEIYRNKIGNYPTRSYPAFQDSEMMQTMKGADREIFVDPVGKFLSRHGSQYTYIGETAEGSETCGSSFYDLNTQQDFAAPDCTKFWVVTTLDNGQEYKQTSD